MKEIKYIPIDGVIPHPKNMNKHSDDQVQRLADIIAHQGFKVPVIISKNSGYLVAGHGRLMAARKLGLADVPAIFAEFPNPDMEYQFMVSDNAIASWAELDLGMINAELENLGPFDIDLLGIKDFVVEPIEKYDEETQDDVPEVKHDPITKRGDIWLLGDHRVMCGDSTMIDDVEKLMKGEKADMVFTDPPYNVGFNYNKHDDNIDNYEDFLRGVWQNIKTMNCQVVLTPGNVNLKTWLNIDDFNYLCWVKKNAMSPSAVAHLNIFEILLCHGTKKRRNTDLIEYSVKQQKDTGDHPCPKLVDLVEDIIKTYSDTENLFFEPFCGSGSTLIACEKTNRKCYGMELDEHYCDVICQRWMNFTGKEAILESTGEKFSELNKKTVD